MTDVDGLSEEQVRLLRERMVAERDRLVGRAESLGDAFDELVAAADLEPPDDEHDPDGTTAYERAQVGSLHAEAEHGIGALDAALARLDVGRDGTCIACRRPIAFERLLAVLGTDRCVACASGRR